MSGNGRRVNTPNAIRVAVVDAVKAIMQGSAPVERMTTKEALQLVQFVATAATGVVLAQLAAEMRNEQYDESAPSGACVDAIAIARDLGYRAGSNDYARRWSKLLDEAVHAGT